ncbi:MAG: TRAP transporter TatT component family protein [Candidatus Eisenbacteria bacterium]
MDRDRSKLVMFLLLLWLGMQGSGCGIGRKVAISSMEPILETTVDAVYRDQDVETVRAGIPANLLLVRGLAESEPGNRDLGSLAAQLYFYYGIGFVEDEDPAQARLLYAQGLALGRRTLERRGWFHPQKPFPEFEKRLRKAGKDDVPLLFWTAANWVAWINQSKEDPAAVADLPYARAVLDRVLQLDPRFFLGMPHVMAGTLLASTPVLMGGDPEAGKRHFEEAFEISEGHLLIFRVLYAQYYCRQVLDEDCFTQSLESVLQAPEDLAPDYRLLNEVARRKASQLLERKDELF